MRQSSPGRRAGGRAAQTPPPSAPAPFPAQSFGRLQTRQRLDELILVSIGRAEDVKLLQRIQSGEEASLSQGQVPRLLLECGFREEWRMQREDGLLDQISGDDLGDLLRDLRASPPRSAGIARPTEGGAAAEWQSHLDAVLRTLRGGVLAQAARQPQPWIAFREYVRQSRQRLRDAASSLRAAVAEAGGERPGAEALRSARRRRGGAAGARSVELRLPRVSSGGSLVSAPPLPPLLRPRRPAPRTRPRPSSAAQPAAPAPAAAPRPPSGKRGGTPGGAGAPSARPKSGTRQPVAHYVVSDFAPRAEVRPPSASSASSSALAPAPAPAPAPPPHSEDPFDTVIRTADQILAEMDAGEDVVPPSPQAQASAPGPRPAPPRPHSGRKPSPHRPRSGGRQPSPTRSRPSPRTASPPRPQSARGAASPPRPARSPPRPASSSSPRRTGSSSAGRAPAGTEAEPPRFEPAPPTAFEPQPLTGWSPGAPPREPPGRAAPDPQELAERAEELGRGHAARRVQRWWRRLRLRRAAGARWRKRWAMLREVDGRWVAAWRAALVAPAAEAHAALLAAAEDDAAFNASRGSQELTASETVYLRWLAARTVQRVVRGWQARKRYRRRLAALIRAQALVRGHLARRRAARWRALAAVRARRAAKGRWLAIRGELEEVAEGADWLAGAQLAVAREAARVQAAAAEEGRMFEAHFRYWDKKMTKWCLGRPFPSTWVPQLEPVSGRTYYLNLETGASQPDHPNLKYAVQNRTRERAKAERVLAQRIGRLAEYRDRLEEFGRGSERAGLEGAAAVSAGYWRRLEEAAYAVAAPEAPPVRKPAEKGAGAKPRRGARVLVRVEGIAYPLRQLRISAATREDARLPLRDWAPLRLPPEPPRVACIC
eukprot:tig00000605_g2481.t1